MATIYSDEGAYRSEKRFLTSFSTKNRPAPGQNDPISVADGKKPFAYKTTDSTFVSHYSAT